MNITQDNWKDDNYLLSRFDNECGNFKAYDDKFVIDDEFDSVDDIELMEFVA